MNLPIWGIDQQRNEIFYPQLYVIENQQLYVIRLLDSKWFVAGHTKRKHIMIRYMHNPMSLFVLR